MAQAGGSWSLTSTCGFGLDQAGPKRGPALLLETLSVQLRPPQRASRSCLESLYRCFRDSYRGAQILVGAAFLRAGFKKGLRGIS